MKHLVLVLTILALVLSVPLAVFAQGGSNPLCSGLSDVDCSKLTNALATVQGVNSFTVPSWSVSFSMNDGKEDIAFAASGRAGVVLGASIQDIVVHLTMDSISMTPASEDVPQTAEVIVANGFSYLNYNGEWFGEALSEEDVEELEETFSSVNLSSMGDMGAGLDKLGIDLTGVINTTRGADAEHMGQSVAAYTMNLDLTGLLMSLLASPMVGEAMGMGGAEAMSPEELQMMGALLVPILGETAIGAGVWVGNDDGYIHRVDFNLALDIDLSMFAPEVGAITGALAFSADVTGVDQGYSVTPPAQFGTMDEFNEKYGDALDGFDLGSATGGF